METIVFLIAKLTAVVGQLIAILAKKNVITKNEADALIASIEATNDEDLLKLLDKVDN